MGPNTASDVQFNLHILNVGLLLFLSVDEEVSKKQQKKEQEVEEEVDEYEVWKKKILAAAAKAKEKETSAT